MSRRGTCNGPTGPTFESGVLSNVWDIAFPNSWRRYRSVRCPDASISVQLDQASRDSIREWFERAEVVDDLPDWITISELASYFVGAVGRLQALILHRPALANSSCD